MNNDVVMVNSKQKKSYSKKGEKKREKKRENHLAKGKITLFHKKKRKKK
jgi:hypothetical protein